jgi:hypothetical protein
VIFNANQKKFKYKTTSYRRKNTYLKDYPVKNNAIYRETVPLKPKGMQKIA